MATKDFLPGVRTLIRSLEENSGLDDFSFDVICIEDLSASDITECGALDTEVNYIEQSELGGVEYNTEILKKNRKRINQNKFLVFKLPYNEPVCYIDADMVCLNDISGIDALDPFSAGVNIGKEPPKSILERPMFNTGFFIFRPSNSVFYELQDFALEFNENTKYGDQRILNEYMYAKHGRSVNLLGLNWNVLISSKHHHPKLWKWCQNTGIKFLHFTKFKPWTRPKKPDQFEQNELSLHAWYTYLRRYIRFYRRRIKYWDELKEWEGYNLNR